MNLYGCNTIISILSIRIYINTSIILLPTILLSLLSSTLFRTFQSVCIMIRGCAHLAVTRLAGITFTGLNTCLAISFPEALCISTKSFSDYVQVSTWKHLKGNSWMKSGHICGQLSFARWYIIQYTVARVRPAPRCTWTSMFECMALKGLWFCRCIQSASPSASHLYTRLGVVWGLEQYPCHSTPSKAQRWMLYLATRGGHFSHFYLRAGPNPSPVAGCLAFYFSSPPEFRLHTSSNPSQPTAIESIQHYRNYPTAASSPMSPKTKQLPSPGGGVNLEPV